MKFATAILNAKYPVYGAKFLDNQVLLIAGGGGEGKNGIPNKLSTLDIETHLAGTHDKSLEIKKLDEYELDPQDDSPTTLDANNGIILVGCNENSEKISSGRGNRHVRKFEYSKRSDDKLYNLKFIEGLDFDKSDDPNEYTKLVNIQKDGSIAAIASSSEPATLRIIDPIDMSEKYEIESTREIKDLQFSPNGKLISYITKNSLEIISTVTGKSVSRNIDFDPDWNLSKIRFVNDNSIIIAASLITGSGIVLISIGFKSGKAIIVKSKSITKIYKGITSMDIDAKGLLAVISTNDNSLMLIKLNSLQIGKIFKQIHSFAIIKVVISPDSQLVASVSAANTVHVISVPQNYSLSLSASESLFNIVSKFIFIVLLAILLQYVYVNDLHSKFVKYVLDLNAKRRSNNATSNYFEQTTLIGKHTASETGSVNI